VDEDYSAGPEMQSLDEAINVTQNRQLWRLMSVLGAVHSWWFMRENKIGRMYEV